MKQIISYDDVWYQYPYSDESVLQGVSFGIQKGQFVSLVGPNGGGKTTVIRLLLGLSQPSKGVVTCQAQTIGYVPQRSIQEDISVPFTVAEVVATGRTTTIGPFRFATNSDRQAIEQAMEQTDISSLKDRPVQELSGGQRQRVYISRALASQPDLLILDEPTVGIDAASEAAFYDLLKNLKQHQVTILFVTHDIDVVSSLSDHVVCLNQKVLCNMPAKSFTKEEYISQVYAGHYVPVQHQCH